MYCSAGLALLMVRIAEYETGDIWPKIQAAVAENSFGPPVKRRIVKIFKMYYRGVQPL